jgi:hypothetical protein
MSNIYNQHAASFRQVSAFVILKGADRVATVAIKFPADGAGRLTAYVHWIGVEMVRGFASGYGYDKRSAACANAAKRIPDDVTGRAGDAESRQAFIDALGDDNGHDWTRRLESAGFTVIQAV